MTALRVTGLSKTFQGQQALEGLDLEIERGEVHGLLGQNGSGKSTLIKVLSGYHQPDPGARAEVDGVPFELGSAHAAREHGFQFIHQDLALAEDLDVVDNLALGERYSGRWWLSGRRERAAARDALESYGVELHVSRPVRELDAAQRAMVAVVRALHHGSAEPGILVLDEPTASLPEREKGQLFELLARVRDRGTTIVYVTHRLQEVFEITDRVTILRDGRRVATRDTASLSHDGLVELIVGRPLSSFYPEPVAARDDVVLRLDDVRGGGVEGVTLDVHAGEVVGLTGLTGSGVDDLLHLVFGALPLAAGTVSVRGAPVSRLTPARAIAAGVGFAPGDRARLASLPEWTLRENVTIPRLRATGRARWLGRRKEAADVRPWLQRFDVDPPDPEARLASLSGGNQQKTILAKWLRSEADVLLLEEPTQGVDVGAKGTIYDALAAVSATGTAILIATSDFEEACAICDRVIVLREGRVGAVLKGADRTVDHVLGEAIRPSSRTPEEIHA